MTNIVRYDPFGDLRTTMDRLFDEGFSRPWRFIGHETETSFPVEVSDTDNAVHVKAALPGVKPEDVEISVANGVLTIKAEHREDMEEKKENFYRRELRYGTLQRALSLPVSVDADRAEATFKNGVVELTLPKSEALRPKQIKVKSS